MYILVSMISIAALLDHAYFLAGALALVALFFALTAR